MKRILALVVLSLVMCVPHARAQQGPDDQYLRIYYLIQAGDALAEKAQAADALAKFKEAQSALETFQKGYPEWNAEVVKFRLNYLASRISDLASKSVAQPPVQPAAPARQAEKPEPSNDLQLKIASLQAQVHQLQSDNQSLQAKLKEALAAQPAVVDPAELAKAQEKIRNLQKENALLEAGAAKSLSTPSVAPAPQPAAPVVSAPSDTQLEAANRELADQKALVTRLTLEKEALQARLKGAPSEPATDAAALRAQNEQLKNEVARMSAATPGGPAVSTSASDQALSQARAQIAVLESDKALLRQQNALLEARLKRSPARGGWFHFGRRKMDQQVADLQARLDALDAKAVPYTPEELALFKQPAPGLASAQGAVKSDRKPSPATVVLLNEAQQLFSAGDFAKAEQKYLQVIREDDRNAPALANLAVIQIQLKELDKAEKNIERAVALSPNDAYSLSVLGQLRFMQHRYDDALSALSKAAKLDPKNPEIENRLGIVLGQKGERRAAETAFRKAIEIQPEYGEAHNNLAIVYLSENPPLIELARWHYQKALAAGHPRNPKLEQMLAAEKSTK